MIQYIINTTAIWLVSLVAFDLFLRKSTLHSYNRVFLIITALLGALLPLYHANPHQARFSPVLIKPIHVVADIKQSIAAVASISHTSFPWSAWIFSAYILGIAISCCMLLREGLILFRWYRSADVQWNGDARLVVTHRMHGPFSAFGYIFISEAKAYTPEELRFILQHEGAHIHRRHYLDKALMLLLRCIFWVNPLVYIYYSRLMLTHEYEADDTARAASSDYSYFLIHQHLAGTAPLIAHSFFHSPLKNRIRMLTAKRTRAWRKAIYLIALPAIAAFAVLWVNNTAARKGVKHGNVIVFGENKFELGIPAMDDRQTAIKPASDPEKKKAAGDAEPTLSFVGRPASIPVKMNGMKIFELWELSNRPMPKDHSLSFKEWLIKETGEELSKLPDGTYDIFISDMIINQSGQVVYYDVHPISWTSGYYVTLENLREQMKQAKIKEDAHPIDEQLKARIMESVERSLDALVLTPGIKDGSPVITRANPDLKPELLIAVSNHQVSLTPLKVR